MTAHVMDQRIELFALDAARSFIAFKSAYDQCSPAVQDSVDEMVRIFEDPKSTEDHKRQALEFIVVAIYPSYSVTIQDRADSMRKSDQGQEANRRLIAQEEAFYERVRTMMKDKGITQGDLGKLLGTSQSSIANLLNRKLRPQRKTVRRIAEALETDPQELFPELGW